MTDRRRLLQKSGSISKCKVCGYDSVVNEFCIVCGPYYCEVCEFTGTALEFEDHLSKFAHMVQDGMG